MYRVTEFFTDLQDDGHVYRTGDIYPRDGLYPKKERVEELSTCANRRGVPLIVLEEVPKECPSEVKGDTQEKEAGESTTKPVTTKRKAKKTQGEL